MFTSMFGKKPTLKEQQRENDKVLRKAGRDIEKERRELEREEKKLELEIKKAAKENNKEACGVLAKQLIQLRKQKTRTYAANSKIQGVGAQNKAMGANVALSNALSTTTKAMGQMNKMMKPEQIARDMQEFSKANMRMEMTDEMINDTLDDIMTEDGDEDEEDAVVQRVLDEIGIEMSGKMAAAPAAVSGRLGETSRVATDDELEAQLAKLKS